MTGTLRASALIGLVVLIGCGGTQTHGSDGGAPTDAGDADAGDVDAGEPDAGELDAGEVDAGEPDAGPCAEGCPAGMECLEGGCACSPPTGLCDGTCLDMTADNQNCGTCGTVCTGATQCVGGMCTPSNIKHVVLIVQENHSFDTYFGLYCQAPTGSNPTCTIGPSCCEAAPATDPTGAMPMQLDDNFNTASDPNHSQACELQEIDDGGMDEYVQGSAIGSSLCDSACSRSQNFALADVGTVAAYWQYANTNALADRYFQPIVGSSSSNDMYFAISHEQFIDNDAEPSSIGAGCDDPTHICVDGTLTSYSGRVTIGDLLLAAGHTFSVYADGYAEAVAAAPSCSGIPSECTYSEILHPIDARSCLYDPSDIPFEYYSQFTDGSEMKDYAQFATDVSSGTLPDFSYMKARTFRNEHPGYSTISDGINFVQQTVETIEGSAYADDTLILLTWDESGGFFDHVPPPPSVDVDDMGNPVPHGPRVPMLAIGKFARAGTVSHVVMEHSSVVRFLEYNFIGKVGLLGYADAKVNNIGSLLDQSATGIPVPEMQ